MIKLLIGGSPCTHWSIAQSKNRETKAEGIGWELFLNYVIAKEKFKPDFFLYENNWSASKEIKDQIQEELGCKLMRINSKLVSAQNRDRFYVFNWDVEQPEDRGILLKDILEDGESWIDKSYALTTRCMGAIPEDTLKRHRHTMIAEAFNPTEEGKSRTLTASYGKYAASDSIKVANPRTGVIEPAQVLNINPSGKGMNGAVIHTEGKSRCLTTNKGEGQKIIEPVRVGIYPTESGELRESQGQRIYSVDGKSVTQSANGGGQGAKMGLYTVPCSYNVPDGCEVIITENSIRCQRNDKKHSTVQGTHVNFWDGKSQTVSVAHAPKIITPSYKPIYEVKNGMITIKDKTYPIKLKDGYYIIRKLTPIECERLQTLPDGYTASVSNTQRYKGLGNGWTAEVIIHILQGALKDVPRDEKIVVLSMYDGIATGRYCLDKIGFTNVEYHAYEIDKYAIQVAMSNYPDIIQHGDAFQVREDGWSI